MRLISSSAEVRCRKAYLRSQVSEIRFVCFLSSVACLLSSVFCPPSSVVGTPLSGNPAAFSEQTHPFSVHDMLAMDRLSDPQVSPDGKWIVLC